MRGKSKSVPVPHDEGCVVMSVRVRPEVDAGFRELAQGTGLTYSALLGRAIDRLRDDPAIAELIAARAEWTRVLAKLESRTAKRSAAKELAASRSS